MVTLPPSSPQRDSTSTEAATYVCILLQVLEEPEYLAEEDAEGGHVTVRPLQVGDEVQEEAVESFTLQDALVVAQDHVGCYGDQHLRAAASTVYTFVCVRVSYVCMYVCMYVHMQACV